MAVFIAVTIAGGKSHDRANEIAARRSNDVSERTDSNEKGKNA